LALAAAMFSHVLRRHLFCFMIVVNKRRFAISYISQQTAEPVGTNDAAAELKGVILPGTPRRRGHVT